MQNPWAKLQQSSGVTEEELQALVGPPSPWLGTTTSQNKTPEKSDEELTEKELVERYPLDAKDAKAMGMTLREYLGPPVKPEDYIRIGGDDLETPPPPLPSKGGQRFNGHWVRTPQGLRFIKDHTWEE